MHKVFFAYAQEDEVSAQELAAHIEDTGIRCWYFGRDSRGGRSWMEMVPPAIQAADVVLLLISQHSVASTNVTREVEFAHHSRRKLLPVCLCTDALHLAQLPPSWLIALGATVRIHAPTIATQRVLRRISDDINALLPRAPAAPDKPLWVSDGIEVDIPIPPGMLFQTPEVQQFLDSNTRYFIAANKGLGKTLLLRRKRSLLWDYHSQPGRDDRSEVCFIPEGRPYLDQFSGDLPTMRDELVTFLGDLRNCRRLWSFALRASAISHFEQLHEQVVNYNSTKGSRVQLQSLIDARVAPTDVFKDALTLTHKGISQLLDDLEHRLDYLYRKIHGGVLFFIDRVEQGLDDLPQAAWISIQAGLLEAAWNLMSANAHVKIFATIREEAYANFGSSTRGNYSAAVLNIKYSPDELRRLLDTLCVHYEGVSGFYDFLGVRTVDNVRGDVVEDSFEYLSRHTVGRPRDFAIVCRHLSAERRRNSLTTDRIREVINEISATEVVSNVFEEVAPFLECLDEVIERRRFFRLIPCNILSRGEIESICCEFNSLESHRYQDLSANTVRHPFCELHRCGLLGVVRPGVNNQLNRQEFKQPHDKLAQCEACLPRNRSRVGARIGVS